MCVRAGARLGECGFCGCESNHGGGRAIAHGPGATADTSFMKYASVLAHGNHVMCTCVQTCAMAGAYLAA